MGKKKTFEYTTPNESTGFLLWKVHNFWQREIKKSLKPFDLTHTQFVILANTYWLSRDNAQVTQVRIAEEAQTDVVMTSNVIRTLEKKEMIIRSEHTTDTRAKKVTLTKYGLKSLKKALNEIENFDKNFFQQLKKPNKFNKELLNLLNQK